MTVVIADSGRVVGTFVQVDGATPVAAAQIVLRTEAGVEAYAVTDTLGRFEILAVPTGRFTVNGRHLLTGRQGQSSGELRFEGDVAAVTLIELASGRVEGFVLHANGVTPASGATVEISSGPSFNQISLQVSASADGSFTFEGVPVGGFSLSAKDPETLLQGSASGSVAFEGERVSREILLEPVGQIKVRVLDSGGLSVSNARIELSSSRSGVTDPNGEFVFDLVKVGTYQIKAHSLTAGREHDGGVATATLESADQVVEATVRFGGIGQVLVTVMGSDGVTSIPSARVTLTAQGSGAGDRPGAFEGTFIGFTDANGVVRLQGVPVGAFFVRAESGTLSGLNLGAIQQPDQEVATTVRLVPSGTIRGRLMLPDAATPAAQAFVTLTFPPQSTLQSGQLQVTTDLTGTFSFNAIPLGGFTISAFEVVSKGVRTVAGSLVADGQVLDLSDVVLDNVSPRVVQMTPTPGINGVPVNASVVLTFSEAMRPNTFVPFVNVALREGQAVVDGQFAFSNGNTTLTFIPTVPLKSMTAYTMTVRSAPDGPEDTEGFKLLDPFVGSFIVEDNIPPAVVAASPVHGAAGVLPDATVRLTFSESIAPGVVLGLTGPGGAVAGEPALALGGTVAIFSPTQYLQPNASYTLILTGATDLAGNALVGGSAVVTFATVDTLAPTIQSLTLVGTPSRIAGSSVTVRPALLGDDVARVEFISVQPASQVSTPAPFDGTFTLPHGPSAVDVIAVAVDQAGNRSSAATLSIPIVANAAPTVTLSRPDGGTTLVPGGVVHIRVEAADDLEVQSVTVSAVGAFSWSRTFVVTPEAGAFTQEFDLDVPDVEGTVTVQAVAVDSVGNISAPSAATWPIVRPTRTTPIITWPVPAAVTYGTPLGAAELNAAADVPGTFIYSPAAGAFLQVGAGQTLSVVFTPADQTLYETTGATVQITVDPAVLQVVPDPKTRVVGTPNPPLSYTLSGFVLGETAGVVSGAPVLSTTASEASPEGAYPITATIGTLSATNYSFTFATGTLMVLPSSGSLLVQHLGSADPRTEGFLDRGGMTAFAPVSNDEGLDAWQITATGGTGYFYHPVDYSNAFIQGWKLTGRVRLSSGSGPAYFGLNPASDRPRFDVQVSDLGGDALVALAGSNLSYTVPGAANDWLLLELVYDPATAQSSLLVDGVQRLTGYAGWSQSLENRGVLFGADGAAANFNLVRFELATEVLDFEDQADAIPYGTEAPSAYRGVTWTNWLHYAPYGAPYQPAGVNAIYAAVDGASIRFPERVFLGAQFSRHPDAIGDVYFELYREGVLVRTSELLADTPSSLTFLPSGYPGLLDEVRVRSLGTTMRGDGSAWIIDNVTFGTFGARIAQAPLAVSGAPASAPNGTSFNVATAGGSGTGGATFNAAGACSNTNGGSMIMMASGSGACLITATKAGDEHYLAVTSPVVSVIATPSGSVLSLSPAALGLPVSASGTLTVSTSAPPAQDLVVSLVSSDLTVVTVPESVSIAAGQTSATFEMITSANAGSSTITAMASGAFPAVSAVTVVDATLNIVETTAALAAGIPGSLTVRLEGGGNVVAVPNGGVPFSALSSNSGCVAVNAGSLPAGALTIPVSVTYGGTETLPCAATISIGTTAFGGDSAAVTVYPAESVYSAAAALSYYNPAAVSTPGGARVSGVAAVSYYNPARVPDPTGARTTGVAAVSYYNPVTGAGTNVGSSMLSISVANGPTATAVAPVQLSRSAGTIYILTISGAALTGATQVSIVGFEDDIVAGLPVVSADGRVLRVDIFVPASTPLGEAHVVVSGPGWSTAQMPTVRVEIVQ